jgi:membrane protein YqaA with SNARE-associated domain
VTGDAIIAAVGIYAGALAVGALSSVVPIISIEVFLVALALTGHAGHVSAIVGLVVLATAGQVIGKLPIYYGARGLASLEGRHRRWLERFRAWTRRLGNSPLGLIGASAVLGIPPFSICSTAAGALQIPIRGFCAVVALGRATRFTALILIALAR